MKYTVSMKVEGYVDLLVEAKDANGAFENAKRDWYVTQIDFNNPKQFNIENVTPVNCEDENGTFTDSNY